MSVAVYCCFSISEILLRKYSRNGLKIHGDQFLPGTKTKTEGDPEGARGPPEDAKARVSPRPCLVGPWAPWPLKVHGCRLEGGG